MRNLITSFALATTIVTLGCTGDTPLGTVEAPPDSGCVRVEAARTYEVYFVIDVSGSMAPFLLDLSRQLQVFAESFPEEDEDDNKVLVDYYVIAFVNDVKWFPDGAGRRMTSPIAVQAAIEQAVEAGQDNFNLTRLVKNAEAEENLLDALAGVIGNSPSADQILVLMATDAPFAESPEVLSTNLPVASTYSGIRDDLERIGARVHAFTLDELDGITRNYRGMPPLTTNPGSTLHNLSDLTDSEDLIQSTLATIAERSACN